jgi:4-amino-4-deoxy-L-arabinose transferase-like glycosyltransferase
MSPDSLPPPVAPRRPWLAAMGLLALLALLFFVRLGQDVPLRSHEALLAETSRNMVLDRPVVRDDGSRPSPWLVPNFNGSDRLKKTPLPYWTVAGLAQLTGAVDEWTARLPNAAAALLAVLVLLALLRRQEDWLTALLGAAVLGTMAQFLMEAREALADMPMAMLVTAALAALWMGVERTGPRRFAWFVASGAAAGLAMIAKGPVPLVVLPGPFLVAVVVVIYRLWRDGRAGKSTAAAWGWTIAGAAVAILLFIGILGLWLIRVPEAWATLWSESVDRSVGELGHKKPESVFFYLLRLPLLVAPWAIFFVWGLVMAVQRWRRQPAARAWLAFVGAWLVGTLAALSAAEGKQDHYILPLVPAAAIFAAMAMRRLLGPTDPANARRGKWLIFGHSAAGLIAGLGGLAVAAWLAWHAGTAPKWLTVVALVGAMPLAVISAIGAVGCATACVLALRGRRVASLAALVVTVVAAFLWAWPTFVGPMDRSTTAAAFCREACAQAPADEPLYSYPAANGSVVFYMGRDLQVRDTPDEVRALVAQGRPFSIIVFGKFRDQLTGIAGLEEVMHHPDPVHPGEGWWLFRWTPGR